MTKILTIRLPESVYESVEKAANRSGLLVSEFLRDLIRAAFETKEQIEKLDEADSDG